jgi:hypothetical protein
VREICMHGLGGGRWLASSQLDAPPPTRQTIMASSNPPERCDPLTNFLTI